MFKLQNHTRWLSALVVAVLVGGLTVLWQHCTHDSKINFLPAHGPAQWILYPKAPDGKLHKSMALSAEFRRSFILKNVPAQADLTLRAFQQSLVLINGQPLSAATNAMVSWKEPVSYEISKVLHAGTNELSVTVQNGDGPPALWLQLTAGETILLSDENWTASLVGSTRLPARLASHTPKIKSGNPLFGGETTAKSFIHRLPAIAIFALLTAGLLRQGKQWHTRYIDRGEPLGSLYSLKFAVIAFGIVAVLLAILFFNNLALLPNSVGFDAAHHLAYIDYIRQHWSLPLASEGWQMYQPPLYYLISACLLSPLQSASGSDTAVQILRLFGLLVCLSQVLFIFLSIRILFPRRLGVQLFGLILAAVLPENLYLCQYVTNETLCAALTSGAIYFCLRIVNNEPRAWLLAGALGLFLGGALLAKVTAIIAVPFLLGALILRLINQRPFSVRAWAGTLGIALFTTVAVCGWHYGRVWKHYGNPIVGNWDASSGYHWWMEDGFRTASYYFRFGCSLTQPFYSGFHGFADGLYSTLWGDGLCGGTVTLDYRPPWNYELMAAGFLLALIPTFLILVGTGFAIHKYLHRRELSWLVLAGFAFSTAAAILYMTLKLPSYGQVKAFYGLIAMLPICVFGAMGWSALEKYKRLASVIAIAFGAWAMTSYGSFWIARWSPESHLNLGVNLARDNRHQDAARQYVEALKLSPNNARARKLLALELLYNGQVNESRQHAEQACKLDPSDADSLFFLATIMAGMGETKPAIENARRAIQLAPDHPFIYESLCDWLLKLGQRDEALVAGREGLRVNPFSEILHYSIGSALADAANHRDAVFHLRYAMKLKPEWAEVHARLAQSLMALAEYEEASKELAEAMRLKPNQPEFHQQLARIQLQQKNATAAIQHFRSALDVNPKFTPALNGLAWLLATHPDVGLRNGKEALQLAQEAAEMDNRGNPLIETTLASALAEIGNFDEAITTLQKAMTLAQSAGQNELVKTDLKLLELFRSHQPYHQEPDFKELAVP
ncbi:MAG: Photosystem assembly protein Ycf3 [Pedosphaera sp.]|nr:Photosystem assembly protein Ycf3 [Pedosphaera sp.]